MRPAEPRLEDHLAVSEPKASRFLTILLALIGSALLLVAAAAAGLDRPTEPVEHGAKFAFYSGGQTARVEYDDIKASTNALIPTPFMFQSPVFEPTAGEYAVIIKFDGAENFILWSMTAGDPLVGQPTVIAVGPSGNFRGTLYQFISDPTQNGSLLPGTGYAYGHTVLDPAIANSAALVYTANTNPLESSDPTYLQSNWTPLINQTLKMKVYAARYFRSGSGCRARRSRRTSAPRITSVA